MPLVWRVSGMMIVLLALWGVLSVRVMIDAYTPPLSEVAPYAVTLNSDTCCVITSTTPATAPPPAQALNWETLLMYVAQLIAIAVLLLPLIYTVFNGRDDEEEERRQRVKKPLR